MKQQHDGSFQEAGGYKLPAELAHAQYHLGAAPRRDGWLQPKNWPLPFSAPD
jgi:hypothetical protein